MPRTKVTKTSKRNREVAAREDKIRDFEKEWEIRVSNLESQCNDSITVVEAALNLLGSRINDLVLNLPFTEFLGLKLDKFNNFQNVHSVNTGLSSISAADTVLSQHRSAKTISDDGYITEDSATSNAVPTVTPFLSMTKRGRTPGPLSSARALRGRRSRSACGDNSVRQPLAPKLTSSNSTTSAEHSARNRLRAPMSARPKALSADRSTTKYRSTQASSPKSPVSAFLRWPRPGELVMSVRGSPLVAQVLPDKSANVNIPIKDGVLSLRPKKIFNLQTDIVENLDPETLKEIKTLHENLDIIVKMAAGGKIHDKNY